MRKIIRSKWILISLSLFCLALTWGEKKEEPQKSAPKKKTTVETVKVVKADSKKSASASAEEETIGLVVPQIPDVKQLRPNIPSTQVVALPKIPKAADYVPAPAPLGSAAANPIGTEEIARIQKQIQEITQLNEALKVRYQSQAAEIQKISDQAKIHQRILSEIQSSHKNPKQLSPEDASTVLEQEKVRMIRQETEEKRALFKNLEEGKPSGTPQDQKATKASGAPSPSAKKA